MKICPVCESALFDDMDTCFGCLYRFGSDPALEAARAAASVPWPVALEGERTIVVAPEWKPAPKEAALASADGAGSGGGGPAGGGVRTGGTCGSGDEGGEGNEADERGEGDDSFAAAPAQVVSVPGWRLRVRSEGPQPQGSSLTIEIEPV